MPELLDDAGIATALASVPQWRREGTEILREIKFKAYLDGVDFASQVGRIAEEMNHHPDIHIGWRKVTLRFSTHSKGGLTARDFQLAGKIDQLAS